MPSLGAGGPEGRERLAAAADIVELGPHQIGQHAPAPVRGQDADDRDPGAVELPARYRQPKRNRPGAADHASLIEGAVHAVERQDTREVLGSLPAGPAAEVMADRANGRLEFLAAPSRPDLDAHQAIFSRGA